MYKEEYYGLICRIYFNIFFKNNLINSYKIIFVLNYS